MNSCFSRPSGGQFLCMPTSYHTTGSCFSEARNRTPSTLSIDPFDARRSYSKVHDIGTPVSFILSTQCLSIALTNKSIIGGGPIGELSPRTCFEKI